MKSSWGFGFGLGLLTCITSCDTVRQPLTVQEHYRRDLSICVNDADCVLGGVVVAPAAKYALELKTQGKMSYVELESLHRHVPLEDQGSSTEFTYIPDPALESDSVIKFSALDADRGRHAFGIMIIQSSQLILPMMLHCNDAPPVKVKGTGYCESKAAKTQVVEFDVDVQLSPAVDEACKPGVTSTSARSFSIDLAGGDCLYVFQEKADPKRSGALYTYGYTQVILKEN